MAFAIAGCGNVSLSAIILLTIGGFLVTGSANALNEVLEREYDQQMSRTSNRPLASGRMSVSEGVLAAGLMAFFGVSTLALFNPLTASLGIVSLLSYAFVYTPMKRISQISVAVGAIPGALPTLIGVVAFEGKISELGLLLFTIQFLWQFVHFWAIAWLADDDYKKAGFIFLPSKYGNKDSMTGLYSLFFGILLIVISIYGFYLGYTGLYSTIFLVMLNVYWSYNCWKLFRECSREAARRQMFTSFIHLPLTLLVFLIECI
jgi:protoheme IX farnesyltransferase